MLTMAIMLTGSGFAQGKGNKGGGGGGKHEGGPPGHQKQADRGGDRGGGQGQQKHAERGGDRGDRGGGEGQGQFKHQQRQMGGGENFGGGQQNKHFERQQRPEARQWQRVERQRQQVYVQPQQRVYVQPQQNWGQVRREQNFERKRYRDEMKSEQHAERDAWKYERKQQHFEDKAYRKAERQYQSSRPYTYERRSPWVDNNAYQPTYRESRTYQPDYRQYETYRPDYRQYQSYQPNYQSNYNPYDYSQLYSPYSGYGYGNNGQYYNSGSGWKEQLIRSVLASFFSNGTDGGYYDDYNSYYQPNYGSNYGYAPQYGSYQPTYNTFGYPPTYTYYEPATYYGYNQYADNGIPYDAFSGSLPYNDVVDIYSGGLAGELIQRALGTGYQQGLLEGQQARRRGWGDRYFSDPYVYEQAIYDPYSTSIGDSRRYFSEGYEMGYQDALRGRDEFGVARGGDIDLVSLLLGSVLSLRG